MLQIVKENKNDENAIIIADFSRISRNPADLLSYRNVLLKYNTQIISIASPHELQLDPAVAYIREENTEQLN
jgi:DNA invertase Pin-like site-specific DNA recombinase